MKGLNMVIDPQKHVDEKLLKHLIADDVNAPVAQVELFMNTLNSTIQTKLAEGNRVEIRGFAVIDSKYSEAYDCTRSRFKESPILQSELTKAFDHIHKNDPRYQG